MNRTTAMTVPKSQAPSSSSSRLSILNTHPHPHLHPHHLKNSALASASVTKTTVDTRATMESFPSSLHAGASEKPSVTSSKNPSSWDPQDDILLRHLKEVKKLGWKDISQYFNNRTPNACQFRWRRLKSGNLKSNKTAHVDVTDFPGNASPNQGSDISESSVGPSLSSSSAPQPSPMTIPVPATPASQAAAAPVSYSQLQPQGQVPAQGQVQAQPHVQTQLQLQSQSQNGAGSIYHHSYSKPSHTTLNLPSNPTVTLSSSMSMSNGNGAGSKFYKARSNSHSFSKPLISAKPSSSVPSEEENIGFIPKIIVRSRRSSFAHPQVLSQPLSVSNPASSLTSTLNATLNTIKSRKNSFTSRSRRSSFNISSNTPSRRSSVVVAPNSLSGFFGSTSGSSTPKLSRRDSMVTLKKDFGNHRSSMPSFMDLPASSIPPHFHRKTSRPHLKQQLNTPVQNGACSNSTSGPWSTDEDKLLSENGSRNLSLMELSILLPNRTEKEIQWRLETLCNDNSPAGSHETSRSPLHSPRKSETPEDTAIEEDNCDTCDENENRNDDEDEIDPLKHSNSPSLGNDSSPSSSIISSTTTNENDHRASVDSNILHDNMNHSHQDHSATTTLKTFRTQSHSNIYIPANNATPLPGISTILKGTL